MVDFKRISSFDANDRLKAFQKNLDDENIFEIINNHLLPIQKQFESCSTDVKHIVILILGLPRSGTTLLSQLLSSRLDIAYPSNLMARFYQTPAIGAFLQKTMLGNRFHHYRNYCSKHGVTKNIEEPHEFGYFWSRHLGVCGEVHEPDQTGMNKVNIDSLRSELQSITSVFRKPAVFKCPLGNFFIPVLKQIPNLFFIDLQRNIIEVAESFWRVRKERLGSVEKWWSLRPKNYFRLREEPPAMQIANQILVIRKAIDQGLDRVEERRKIVVKFEKMIEMPEAVIDDILQKLLGLQCRVEKVGEPIFALKHSNKYNDNNLFKEFQKNFSLLEKQFER